MPGWSHQRPLSPHSKNNRSFDTPVKGPPQGPRLHIDIPRVQLLIEDKEGIKQLGEHRKNSRPLGVPWMG